MTTRRDTLVGAVVTAARAPGVSGGVPWTWRVADDGLELVRSGPESSPPWAVFDCGLTLHHARVGLAAAGWLVDVRLFPDAGRPDLVARVSYLAQRPPRAWDRLLREAVGDHVRSAEPDPPRIRAIVARMVEAAGVEGAHLSLLPPAAGDDPGSAGRLRLRWAGADPVDWLRAGQAASAAMLTGAVSGLRVALTDPVTAPTGAGGTGDASVVLRYQVPSAASSGTFAPAA